MPQKKKPQPQQSKQPKQRHVMFWFETNRGTSIKMVFTTRLPKDEIEDRHHEWARRIINNGSYSESIIHHGYENITVPMRAEVLKKYHAVCIAKAKLQRRCEVLAAMLNPQELI